MKRGKHAWRILGLGLGLVLGMACSSGPTNTGFTGTWARGNSLVSIRKGEDGYHFRWSKSEPQVVRCTSDDFCEEFKGDLKIFEHRFRLSEREGQSDLYLETTITAVPDDAEPIHVVERLQLQPGGLQLWSTMIEAGGKSVEEKRTLILEKLSDEPF